MKYVIGIDPDSSKHGIAVYKDERLIELQSMPLMEFMDYLIELDTDQISFHIEDVNGQKAVWHGKNQSKSAYGMTSQNVAKCKQAQIEIERMIEHLFGAGKITRHKISKQWKDQAGKRQFELVTGWKGRSNEDMRSASYFGYLGLKQKTQHTVKS